MLTDLRDSNVRSAHEAELDDIIGLLDILHDHGHVQHLQFVAADLERLPRFDPKELNIGAVVDRLQKTDIIVGKLSSEVEQLKEISTSNSSDFAATYSVVGSALVDLQQRIGVFQTPMISRIDQMNNVCTQLRLPDAGHINNITMHDEVDRSLNIVLFSVAENRDITIWRSKVDDILKFIVGIDVDVADAFRLGRFKSDKAHQVLIKLRSIWDKRLILKTARKMKSYPEEIFIGPDKSLEFRRKRTFVRLKYRAGKDWKNVSANDDITACTVVLRKLL